MRRQLHVYYSGMVQGVGFRYRTQSIALSLGVNGWVRNLPDGRVEVLAWAEQRKLEEFSLAIESSLGAYIRNFHDLWEDCISECKDNLKNGFYIKY